MLTRMKRLLLILLFAAAAFAADLSGTWKFDVDTDAGSGSPTFMLKQDGEKLSGTYHGQLGDAPVTGTAKGNNFEFSFKVNNDGADLTVKYTGVLDGDKKVKGTIDFGSLGKGSFTGAKQ